MAITAADVKNVAADADRNLERPMTRMASTLLPLLWICLLVLLICMEYATTGDRRVGIMQNTVRKDERHLVTDALFLVGMMVAMENDDVSLIWQGRWMDNKKTKIP